MKDSAASIRTYIAAHCARAEELSSQRLSEADTKRVLIEPFLAALGWDMHGITEVKNEWRGAPSDNPVDYALFINRKPVAIIEAKALGASINDRRCIIQTVQYASNCGVPWAVLTNGSDWALYNALAAMDAEQKLFRSAKGSADDLLQIAQLLTKDSLREAKIDELWKFEFAGQQILNRLTDAFSQPDPKLVRWIQAQLKDLPRKDIVDCLRQFTISLPPVTLSLIDSAPRKTQRAAKPTEAPQPPEPEQPVPASREREGTAISLLKAFFENKWQSDPAWFERNANDPLVVGRNRRAFGKSNEEIYLGGSPATVRSRQVSNGPWFYDANLSRESIQRRIKILSQLP